MYSYALLKSTILGFVSLNLSYTDLKKLFVTSSSYEYKISFKYSPIFLLDWMRMLEAVILEQKAKRKNPKREGVISFPQDVDSLLKSELKNVLLIDDAIDSGATLHLLKEYLEKHYANIVVKIAVITVTTPNPIVDADYFLFHDRVLVRFPWSNDVKMKK